MKQLSLFFLAIAILAFKAPSLKGTYKYAGGIFNGKAEAPSKDYELQRKYTDAHFEATVLEPEQPPFKYQAGDYNLQADSCLETETFNAQSAKLTGKTLHYSYTFRKDTLVLKGILPNGSTAEEHWVRIKK